MSNQKRLLILSILFLPFIFIVNAASNNINERSNLEKSLITNPKLAESLLVYCNFEELDCYQLNNCYCNLTETEFLQFTITYRWEPPRPENPICTWATDLPLGATYPETAGIGQVESNFTWTPNYCQSGMYHPSFWGGWPCQNPGGNLTIHLDTSNRNRNPTWDAHKKKYVYIFGEKILLNISRATDLDQIECFDDSIILLNHSTLLPGCLFYDNLNGTGFVDCGNYSILPGYYNFTFRAIDNYSGYDDQLIELEVKSQLVLSGKCGDANNDNKINLQDIIYLINYIFKGGPLPFNLDPNNDGKFNLADVIYLVNHIFKGGPEPCEIFVNQLPQGEIRGCSTTSLFDLFQDQPPAGHAEISRNLTGVNQLANASWGNASCGPSSVTAILEYLNRTRLRGIMNQSINDTVSRLRELIGTTNNGTSTTNIINGLLNYTNATGFIRNISISWYDNITRYYRYPNGTSNGTLIPNFNVTYLPWNFRVLYHTAKPNFSYIAQEFVTNNEDLVTGFKHTTLNYSHFMALDDINRRANQDGWYNVSFMDPWVGTTIYTTMHKDGTIRGDDEDGNGTEDFLVLTDIITISVR